MKQYQKAQMIAKNLPTGSYAAGCPAYQSGNGWENFAGAGNPNNSCRYCEATK